MNSRNGSCVHSDKTWRAILDATFDEPGYWRRLRAMWRGLHAPPESRARRVARLELQRQAAPASAVAIPLLLLLLLLFFTMGSRPPPESTWTVWRDPADKPTEPVVPLRDPPPPEPSPTSSQPDFRLPTIDPPPLVSPPTCVPTEAVAPVPSPLRMAMPVSFRTPAAASDRLSQQSRRDAISRHDGDPRVEDAVMRALRWLKLNQRTDGSWAATRHKGAETAMTAMAVLSFLAHGERPDGTEPTEFGPSVQTGLAFLCAAQQPDGLFKPRDGNNYTQPIAVYALCEGYAMTGNPNVRDAAQRGLARILAGQHASGGWDYNLTPDTTRDDTSYMAWCAQALKAAQIAGIEAPGLDRAIERAIAGFRANADAAAGFGYTSPGRTGLSAAGALCLLMLGAGDTPQARQTLAWLREATCRFETWQRQPYVGSSPLYYWYYLTQASFHAGGPLWKTWNAQFAGELIDRQQIVPDAIPDASGRPAAAGFWTSPSPGEHSAGEVQDTCLCALQLMVYYRYLRTYDAAAVSPPPRTIATAGDVPVSVNL